MEYVVQPGDTLSAIARRFGVTLAALLAVNPEIADPDLIFAGQLIRIPLLPPSRPPIGRLLYVVQPGDTLSGIARRFGVDLTTLINANPQIPNPDLIFPGQVIFVPLIRITGVVAEPVPIPGKAFELSLELEARAEKSVGMPGMHTGMPMDMPMGMATETPLGMATDMPLEMEMPFEIPMGAGADTSLGELPPLPPLPELPRTHFRPAPEDRHHRHR